MAGGGDENQGSPSHALPPQSPFGGSLRFKKPSARGRKSTNNLRQQKDSTASDSAPAAAAAAAAAATAGAAGIMTTSTDADTGAAYSSRTASPAPSAISTSDASQNTLPSSSPREATLQSASATLTRLMEDAHSGSFAVGALGQKLLDQQMQIKTLMERLEGAAADQDASSAAVKDSRHLVEQTQAQVAQMKEEQQRLAVDFLQASNIDVGALFASAASNNDAHALITSLGMQLPTKSDTSASQSTSSAAREMRRQKNAAAPNLSKDENLINDIQQQLIGEIRRLQALVAERDKALAAMSEALDEAARIQSLHEASIKKLEAEKDTQDANLYELEAKEAMLRDEHEGVVKQLKKLENEARVLKRQLAEKTDAAETYKASNEDLEERMEGMRGSVATLKAKGVADQKAISGLKAQVNDYEVKHRQALEKIPASNSGWSQSAGHDDLADASQMSAQKRSAPDTPEYGRGAAHNQALTPTESVDEALASRLRPNETIKNMEADIAKWKAAAFKYRKKWNENRRQGGHAADSQEHDDSTDEDEAMWTDEPSGLRRLASARSRLVSSSSRRGKTMGDAFGFYRGADKRASVQSLAASERSLREDDDDSEAGSTRGSVDGFDPSYADPTLRGRKANRQSVGPSSKASPLTRQLQLQEDDSHSEQDTSFAGSEQNRSLVHAGGALGDELLAVQGQGETHSAVDLEESLAEREAEHAADLEAMRKAHAESLAKQTSSHDHALADLQHKHGQALVSRDSEHDGYVATLQKQHAESIAQQIASHSQILGSLQEKHARALASRDAAHDTFIAEIEKKYIEKESATKAKQAQVHEQLMAEARQRHAEALSQQRQEGQTSLIATQREHKKLVDEREKMHTVALLAKESEHERSSMLKQREHEGEMEDVRSTHDNYARQLETAFGKRIAEKDALIQAKDEEISTMLKRLQGLERELAAAMASVHAAESKLSSTDKELYALREAQVPSLDSHKSLEDYQDAPEQTVAAHVDRPAMRESASQTDNLAAAASNEDNKRNVEGTWLAESSTIQRLANPPGASEVMPALAISKPSKDVDYSKPPVLSIPPPPEGKPPMSRSASSGQISVPSRPTSPPPSDLLARSHGGKDAQRSSSRAGPPPSSYMPPPSELPRHSQGGARMGEGHAYGKSIDRSSISSRLSRHPVRAPSAQSFASVTTTDVMSGRSSHASGYGDEERRQQLAAARGPNAFAQSTDPAIVGAITSAMIGTYMHKYTRRGMGRNNKRHRRYFWVHPYTRNLYWTEQAPSEAVSSEALNRSAFIQDVLVVDDDSPNPPGLYHQSIIVQSLSREIKMTASTRQQHELWITALGFLVNRELPSSEAPGRAEPSEWRQSIRTAGSVARPSSRLSGRKSLANSTLTTPARERPGVSPRRSFASLTGRSRSARDDAESESTPRARGATIGASNMQSLLHRKDTAAREYMEQWELLQKQDADSTPRAGATSSMSRRSARGSLAREMFGNANGSTRPATSAGIRGDDASNASRVGGASRFRDPRTMTAEEMLEEDENRAGFEGLDNVRACCNGKHDVGSLSHRRHQHEHSGRGRQAKGRVSTRSLAPGSPRRGSQRSSTQASSKQGSVTDSEDEKASRMAARPPTAPPQLGPLELNVLDNKALGATRSLEKDGDMAESTTIKANLSNLGIKPAAGAQGASSSSEFGSLRGGRAHARGTAPDDEDSEAASTAAERERARLAAGTPSSMASTRTSGSGAGTRLPAKIDKMLQIRRNRHSASIR